MSPARASYTGTDQDFRQTGWEEQQSSPARAQTTPMDHSPTLRNYKPFINKSIKKGERCKNTFLGGPQRGRHCQNHLAREGNPARGRMEIGGPEVQLVGGTAKRVARALGGECANAEASQGMIGWGS